ncbi:hypothetical protein NQ317_005197 [Molorchus minor]|uniref:Uncharacterized protein n=1 Tax=Molorchus minor TaxID=1323400 RepID=A0ABQ9IQH7_9CUCU|nr:hypothetical protein NQ317_005197 [Molorchus minor]
MRDRSGAAGMRIWPAMAMYNMYSLVKYTDGVFDIIENKYIKYRRASEASARWRGKGPFYSIKVYQESNNVETLSILKSKYENDAIVQNSENFDAEVHNKLKNIYSSDAGIPSTSSVLSLIAFNNEAVSLINSDVNIKKKTKYPPKEYYCQFCEKLVKKFGRHILSMHKFEDEIKPILSLPKKSNERKRLIDAGARALWVEAGVDDRKGEFIAPSTASALGTMLKFCSAILESDYIKKQNEPNRIEVENFLKLLRTELPLDINKTATENQSTIRRHKKVILPPSSDIQKIMSFLKSNREKHLQKLKEKFSFEDWKCLAGYTLVSIMIFNGRRPGEIERITITDFRDSAQSIKERAEIEGAGSTQQSTYIRCLIRGKLCSNVSVMLHEDDVCSMNIILDNRQLAGVDLQNPFIFGLPSCKPYKFLSAGTLLKKYVLCANLDYPDRFCATNIRKNLATKTKQLELHHEDREHVMTFMGHSEKIHKTIYRQPDVNKDILIMPKILNNALGNSHLEGISNDDTLHCPSNKSEEAQQTLRSLKINKINETITPVLNNCHANMTSNSTSLRNKGRTSICIDSSNGHCDSDSNYNTPDESDSDSEIEYPPKKRSRLIDMSLGVIKRQSWNTEEREAARTFFEDELCTKKIQHKRDCPKKSRGSEKILDDPEKQICRKEFGRYVQQESYPSREECMKVLRKYPELQHRTTDMLIGHIQHAIKKVKSKKK